MQKLVWLVETQPRRNGSLAMSCPERRTQKATETIVIHGHPALPFYLRCRGGCKSMSSGYETRLLKRECKRSGGLLCPRGWLCRLHMCETGSPPGQSSGTELVQDDIVVKEK